MFLALNIKDMNDSDKIIRSIKCGVCGERGSMGCSAMCCLKV